MNAWSYFPHSCVRDIEIVVWIFVTCDKVLEINISLKNGWLRSDWHFSSKIFSKNAFAKIGRLFLAATSFNGLIKLHFMNLLALLCLILVPLVQFMSIALGQL